MGKREQKEKKEELLIIKSETDQSVLHKILTRRNLKFRYVPH